MYFIGTIKGEYLKRIPASVVMEKSLPELMELVRERMGEAIKPVDDKEIFGKGRKFYLELFGFFFLNLFLAYLFFI